MLSWTHLLFDVMRNPLFLFFFTSTFYACLEANFSLCLNPFTRCSTHKSLPMDSTSTWTGENFRLFNTICQAQVFTIEGRELQHQLQLNRQKFIDLLDKEPEDAADREALLFSCKALDNLFHYHSTETEPTFLLF